MRSCQVLQLPPGAVLHVLDSVVGGAPKLTEQAILAAFASAEQVAFPAQELQALMPDLWVHLSLVSDTLSVPLSWVLLAEVCTAAFLAPTSLLLPTKTMPIYPMPWAFILHPGATQTSGLMAAFQRTMRQIEIWEHEYQQQEAKARQQAPPQPDERPDGEAAEQPPKKLRFSPPPPTRMSFSSGSVDGVVQRMAEPQNISRAAAFLAEGLIFLGWISDQCGANKGLITQLTDRMLWDKVTVKARWVSFFAPYFLSFPCFGFFPTIKFCPRFPPS